MFLTSWTSIYRGLVQRRKIDRQAFYQNVQDKSKKIKRSEGELRSEGVSMGRCPFCPLIL